MKKIEVGFNGNEIIDAHLAAETSTLTIPNDNDVEFFTIEIGNIETYNSLDNSELIQSIQNYIKANIKNFEQMAQDEAEDVILRIPFASEKDRNENKELYI